MSAVLSAKVDLFGNNRIAIQDKHATAKTIVEYNKGEECCFSNFLTYFLMIFIFSIIVGLQYSVLFYVKINFISYPFLIFLFLFIYLFIFCFLGPHLWLMEVARLWVQLELQLLACTTATATPDLSRVCDLHHSSPQCQILNPLIKARDWTRNLMVPSQISFHFTTTETPTILLLKAILLWS